MAYSYTTQLLLTTQRLLKISFDFSLFCTFCCFNNNVSPQIGYLFLWLFFSDRFQSISQPIKIASKCSSHLFFFTLLRPGYGVEVRQDVLFTTRFTETLLAIHATRQGTSLILECFPILSLPVFVFLPGYPHASPTLLLQLVLFFSRNVQLMNLKMLFLPTGSLKKRFKKGVGVDCRGERRRKVVNEICLGTCGGQLGLRLERRCAVVESDQNTAGLSIAQGEDNLSCFCVNVYVVDMIPDKLSQDRSLCSSLCSNKVAGNSGNWGIVSVTLWLSEGHFRLQQCPAYPPHTVNVVQSHVQSHVQSLAVGTEHIAGGECQLVTS